MTIQAIVDATAALFTVGTLPEITNIQKRRPEDANETYPAMYIYPVAYTDRYQSVNGAMTEHTLGITVFYQIDVDTASQSLTNQQQMHAVVDKIRKLVAKTKTLGDTCTVSLPSSGAFRVAASPSLLYVCDMTFRAKSVEQFV